MTVNSIFKERFQAKIIGGVIKQDYSLKVPKCEIFHLFDLNDFYGIKSL